VTKSNTSESTIAIVGLGGNFPDASHVEKFWTNICDGHVAIGEVPAERWDDELYYSSDRQAPDRTYSKIGAFVKDVRFDRKMFRIPPRTAEYIDFVQKLALTAVADALEDAGLAVFAGSETGTDFDRDRTAVILGNTMGGQAEDLSNLRVWFPEVTKRLKQSPQLASLSEAERDALMEDLETRYKSWLPKITEDSMPGELANCIAGRVANAFDLRGANYTTDAACAASMAAMKTAIDGLRIGDYDTAIVGGVDQTMDPPTFVKFSKIGALSADHSVPFDERANGFVMGEGCGILILKRLEDAERDGNKIYALIRGVGASSDGKGKGITAPNPRGQRMAIERAYENAKLPIDSVSLFEAHGTSTKVGDRVELEVLSEALEKSGMEPQGIAIGSVKSMIGHLKSAAGAAALIKTSLALHHKMLPPSAGFIAAAKDSPLHDGYLKVNTKLQPWEQAGPRRAGVSAFGFGGTNFHVVMEEYAHGGHTNMSKTPSGETVSTQAQTSGYQAQAAGAGDKAAVLAELTQLFAKQTGYEIDELEPDFQLEADLGIDTVKQAEIFAIIREQYGINEQSEFKLSDVQTLDLVADYVMSGRTETQAPTETTEAVMIEEPKNTVLVFGGSSRTEVLETALALTKNATDFPGDFIAAREVAANAPCRLAFVAKSIEQVQSKLEDAGKRSDRILAARGIYFGEGTDTSAGKTAFLFPGQGSQYLGMLKDLSEQYPVIAQTFEEANDILKPLIGGVLLTDIVWPEGVDIKDKAANKALVQTEICQPAMLTADIALMRLLNGFGINPDYVVGHSLGEYAACVAAGVMTFAEALYSVSARGREMASVKVEDNGKMASVSGSTEKVEAILKNVDGYVIAANKNCHAQTVIAGKSEAVEAAVAAFTEAGIDARLIPVSHAFHSSIVSPAAKPLANALATLDLKAPRTPIFSNVHAGPYPTTKDEIVALLAEQLESPVEFIKQIEALHAEGVRSFVEVGPKRAITGFVHNILEGKPYMAVYTNHHKKSGEDGLFESLAALAASGLNIDFTGEAPEVVVNEQDSDLREVSKAHHIDEPQLTSAAQDPIVVSGVSIALPQEDPTGREGDDLFAQILGGQSFISDIGDASREKVLDKNVVRLAKATGEFEKMTELSQVIQIAARAGKVDLVEDYGIDAGLNDALDVTSRLAIATSIEAIKDAGLPLVRRYRTTTTGKQLGDGWALPDSVGRETGVIFASAFPGVDRLIEDVSKQVASQYAAREGNKLNELIDAYAQTLSQPEEKKRLLDTFAEHREELKEEAALYAFNRKFLFRVLSMGHTQVAQVIGARGPNTQINAACASGAQGIAIACDWIRTGRCERVVVVSADDVTHENNLPFIGTGFMAAGAATVEKDPAKAAVPFGATRNGMILGSGASAFIVERDSVMEQRGMEPLVDILEGHFANAAFHATRLESSFIREAFQSVVGKIATALNTTPEQLAHRTFFMSHETYTPARGGSSQSEVDALRSAFGDAAKNVLITNTKGYTGHPMGASLEDVVAIKGLQRNQVPAIANLVEPDPIFADLLFCRGGSMDRDIGIRFAAGFGSQLALVVYKKRATHEGRLIDAEKYQSWMHEVSGTENASYEVHKRTLRVAQESGVALWELGVPSLELKPIEVKNTEADVVAPAPAPVPVAAVSVLDRAQVLGELTELFAKQTGYETDELESDFLLEADLGIDTVKQAEIFGLIRSQYGISQDDSFRLSDVQTLEAVTDYVMGQMNVTEAPEPMVRAETPVENTAEVVAAPVANHATVLAELTDLFAKQTGYETDELDPDYQLEADLGIDTVKQAEIFGLIREQYGMGQDDSFKLSDFQTLHAVTDYVLSMVGHGGVAAAQDNTVETLVEETPVMVTKEPTASVAAPADAGNLLAELQAIFAEHTGYDVEELEPEYQLEADLGIDTVKQAEIFSVIREKYELGQDDSFSLSDYQTLQEVVGYVESGKTTMVAVAAQVNEASVEALPSAAEVTPNDRPTILAALIDLFVLETGYEADELEPDFQLEADLGIDTVKQAEIFSVIRQRYGIKQDEDFKLADYQTLNAICDFVISNMGTEPRDPEPTKAAKPDSQANILSGTFSVDKVGVVEAPALLQGEVSLLGKKFLLVARNTAVRSAVENELKVRGAKSVAVDSWGQAREQITGQTFGGVVCVSEKTVNSAAAALELAGAFETIRLLALERGGEMDGVCLLLATESAGVFGALAQTGDGELAAGYAGIAKSLTKEWPGARTLALDTDGRSALALATTMLDELQSEGPSEISWHAGKRLTLQRVESLEQLSVDADEVKTVVATGGARGVTFEILRNMAQMAPRDFVIMARTVGVSVEQSPISGRSAKEQKEIAKATLAAKGDRVTPVTIRRWIEKQERQLDVTANMDALVQLGSTVQVLQCDVADAGSVERAIQTTCAKHDQIDLLIHGAGFEESKFIHQKDENSFHWTFKPKAAALSVLMTGLKPARVMTMGSVAGRFGNAGQADYSASNEWLAASARSIGSNILNVCWTAWGDVGMATRGSVQQVLEASGVDLLPAKEGAAIGAALALSALNGDVVVAGELGSFSGLEQANPVLFIQEDQSVSTGIFDRSEKTETGMRYTVSFDPKVDLGLDDHRVDGIPLLPGVLGVELMVQGLKMHLGESVSELRDVRFQKPVKFFKDEAMDIIIEVQTLQDGHAKASLNTELTTPKGKVIARTHFVADAFIGERLEVNRVLPDRLEMPRDPRLTRSDIYSRYFHGPRFQVIGDVSRMGEDGVEIEPLTERPEWVGNMSHDEFMTVPYLREAGFQAAGLWEMAELGRMGLPAGIDTLHLGEPIPADVPVLISVRRRAFGESGASFDVWLHDGMGRIFEVMRGYRTATLRTLSTRERFEPVRAQAEVPDWVRINIADVDAMLDADLRGTVKKYLSGEEITRFDTLKTQKRKRDWLAGRIAAKRLIREARFGKEGAIIPYGAISILPDHLGAPTIVIVGEGISDSRVSISHSGSMAAAMYCAESDVLPGIDVEIIEPRHDSWADGYFTKAERQWADQANNRDRALTAAWAIKEAYLKAIGIGARADFRDIDVSYDGQTWSVSVDGTVAKRLAEVGGGEAVISVGLEEDIVVARVYLTKLSQKETTSQTHI
jgi:malonyl CoA-acyl carrier protein transacylase